MSEFIALVVLEMIVYGYAINKYLRKNVDLRKEVREHHKEHHNKD